MPKESIRSWIILHFLSNFQKRFYRVTFFHAILFWFFKANGLAKFWREFSNKKILQSHWLLPKLLGKFYAFYFWSDFSRRSWRHGSYSNTALDTFGIIQIWQNFFLQKLITYHIANMQSTKITILRSYFKLGNII